MDKLYSWFSWFNRERIILLIGLLVLLLGVIFPWYRLPQETLETFNANLFWANTVRIPIVLFTIVGFIFAFLFRVYSTYRLLLWSALIPIILFPFFIVTWSPTVAFIASFTYNQAKAVSLHVDQNFPQVQANWKQNITFYQPEAPTSIFEMTIENSRFFQMPSWEKIIIDGFGYKNSFFTFIGKGWSFSLIGIIISLFGLYLGLDKQSFNAFYQDLKVLIPGVAFLFTIILISLIGVNIANYQLDTQFAKGNYPQVVNDSKTLASLYPPLQGDEAFLERLAKAEFYTNTPEPALINFVQGLEAYNLGEFQKAENDFQQSLNIQPSSFLTRGYLVSTILHQGINYLNEPHARKPGAAIDFFEKALQVFPGNIEALYDLMLARVINGEFYKSADVAKQIIAGQQYFQEPRIGLLGQAYVHLTWDSYHNGDITESWKRYRQSVDTKAWKESSDDE
ncbi:MAG: hypothetical protein KME21_21285 [Desmonostoc vinosum HA7617-LM4]|jgi:tetratricopeptide (TPR) repeat protein|nr:hypothetical protein [Desmonostoc vinosum HA7617-LM4]